MEPRWERGWVELAHADELPWEPMHGAGWPAGAEVRALSRDPASGALTGIVRLPPGYRREAGHHEGTAEFLVLAGALRVGGALRACGYYEYDPPRVTQERWVSDQGVELLFMARSGTPDFLPEPGQGDGTERLRLDTAAMEWIVTPVAGPPPGICVKPLRHVEETGQLAALVASVPEYDYPKLEFHDCIEEIYCVSGDIWLGNSGTMRAGSYLWRPPYITHGPFFSRGGCVLFLWVDETLVNHFVDDPRSSREDNRRRAEQERADTRR
jgi:hypothetical protein